MGGHGNSISFEDWLAGLSPEIQQTIHEEGNALTARYDAEVVKSAAAKQLHEKCMASLTQL